MKKTLLVSYLALALGLAGCGSIGQLDNAAAAPSDAESIFIVGINPENVRVAFFSGEVAQDIFTPSLGLAVLKGYPTNGYLVGKAKAGATVAIMQVTYANEPGDLTGQTFFACGNAKTMVFKVPRGKVIYLGTIDYKFGFQNKMGVRYSTDLEAVGKYVATTFPALKGKVEPLAPQYLPTSTSCARTSIIYIPSYSTGKR